MRRTVLVPIVLVLCMFRAAASAEELPLADRIDAIFAPFAAPGSPGAAVAVIRDGEVVHAKGYGLANLELGVPITPESVFYLGSVSKQFVAASIALLEQQGKLSLDDDVRKYVPEIPDYGAPITVRHLVHHTSGIRDYLELMGIAGLPLGTFHDNQGVVDLIARQKGLNFVPGERHLYSNSGYFLLAVIVEKASGMSLREYAEKHIFGPLGMEHTHFHDDYMHLIPNRASGYFAGPDGYRNFLTTFDRVGSGGVFSSVEDLVLWDRNFYTGEVGGEAFLARMHERGTRNDGKRLDYAFGLTIREHRGLRVVEHGGALGGYRSTIVRIPDERFSVIVLANVSTAQPGSLAMQVVELALADRIETIAGKTPGAAGEAGSGESVEVPTETLRRLEGSYWNAEDRNTRRIYVNADGVLMYARGLQSETPLAALGDDRFRMLGTPVDVEVAFREFDGGRPSTMVVTVDGDDPAVLTRYEPAGVTPADRAALAGRYHGDELPVDYDIVERGGVLVARGPDRSETPLLPGPEDVFVAGGAVVRFTRGDDGAVDGFVLDTGRAQGLRFERR